MEPPASPDQGVTKANGTDGVLPTTSEAPVHPSGADDCSRGTDADNDGDDVSRSSGGRSSEYDDSTGGSDDESDGNDSSDGDSHSDSESDEEDAEEEGGISSLQLRRQQNIQRQMELREKLFGNMNPLKKNVGESGRGRKRKQPNSGNVDLNGDSAEYPAVASKPKKRGILLTSEVEAYQEQLKFQSILDKTASSLGTTDSSSKNQHPSLPPLLVYQVLEKKYPHRSFQIQQLTSILDMNVQKTKMAWNMTENTKSFRNQSNYCDNLFSEASYQGNIKMPSPTPIMITGAGGCGKTSIVRDAVRMIRIRANDETSFESVSNGNESQAGASGNYKAEKNKKTIEPMVAEAYVDCASGESGSVSLVLNNAFRQLHRCFYPKVDEEENERGQMRNPLSNGISVSKDNQTESKEDMTELQEGDDDGDNDEMVGGFGSDIDESDEGNDIEEDLERMRKTHFRKRLNKKLHRGSTPSAYARKAQLSPEKKKRQTRHSLAAGAKQKKLNGNESFSGFKGSASDTAGNSKESSPVAFFGRAMSTLLQGGQSGGVSQLSSASCKRMSNGRCAILILDNAERIMSWRQQGSKNALLQIMRLPSLMGLNLTLILITRSAVLQYSRVCHHVYMCSSNPSTVSELVRPINIHFEAYAGIDAIKTVLNVPHMKFSVTGLESTSKELPCVPYIYLRSKLHDLLYNSMLSMFLPSIERRTRDLCEISRLARMLWKEYVAPLESKEHTNADQSIFFLTKQILVSMYRERRCSMKTCSSNCNFCQQLSSKSESNPGETEFSSLKTQLIGKLDQEARESMRILLSTCVMMPGRVIRKQHGVPYVERLPYTTKFLLLAAFLCQNKRPEQDVNLYTSKNTGKSRKKVDNSISGAAYATTSTELKQITGRKPTFPLERMLSIFTSIMGQYGTILSRRDDGTPAVAHLGTEILFRAVSQLRATGLLKVTGKIGSGDNPLELMHAKFSCTLSREDAKVIAASVDFPLETYCA